MKATFHDPSQKLRECFPGWKFVRWRSTGQKAIIKSLDYIQTGWQQSGSVRFIVELPDGSTESWHLNMIDRITQEQYEEETTRRRS